MMEIISLQTIFLFYLINILYCAVAKPLGSNYEKVSEELKDLIENTHDYACFDSSENWIHKNEEYFNDDLKTVYDYIKNNDGSVSLNKANDYLKSVGCKIDQGQTSNPITLKCFDDFLKYVQEIMKDIKYEV
ncbi:uncharacterized protein LOC126899490 [Daktulosphaira vitifoliae]|uniref:uncharacterized protein LOC126899490 n=1 Tax=Daktulosphaira vitifoliae TaxID=58002 RepID=UPI0021AAD42C|nr:uncharacterized protein LOC126899490 [Daktulosphaira vitifoliae]